MNTKRYDRIQNLGKNLNMMTSSSLRRDCCKAKRNKALSLSMAPEVQENKIWNFKDRFAEIDDKISNKRLTYNSLMNQDTVKDYIHDSFYNLEEIKRRHKLYRKKIYL